jgi:tRNA (guanine37-N1)-methyltransferase
MKVDIITIFPAMVEAALVEGVVGRARSRGIVDIAVHNLRRFTSDKHHVVDDVPFGGGPGMVLKPEPLVTAVETIRAERGVPGAVVLTSPAGRRFTQAEAKRFAGLGHVVVICGRYEGIDERVRELLVTDEVSIGDYVLSGGELPALVIVDAIARLVPGVVGDEQSVEADSFSRGLLDYPHYTRPADFRGHKVPDVLLSGHHGEIRRWRLRQSLERTLDRRPELVVESTLNQEEKAALREVRNARAAEEGSE